VSVGNKNHPDKVNGLLFSKERLEASPNLKYWRLADVSA
jgi:hypothetical protein